LNSEIRKHLPIDRIEAHSGGGDFVSFSCFFYGFLSLDLPFVRVFLLCVCGMLFRVFGVNQWMSVSVMVVVMLLLRF
jgi:hypothetical protein